jgi:pyruvate/2-oxoglutarate dehydrogenase complex dihydrolipoamide dehydrogenase (E3) component
MKEKYDAVVLGAGQGGVPLAVALARAGRRTALVERGHVGGTCVNEGCTPTKTMIASARVAATVRRAAEFGVRTAPPEVDMRDVRKRKREMVESFRSGSEKRISDTANLDLVRGEASFAGPKTLAVRLSGGAETSLTAGIVVVDTCTRPRAPDLPGIERVPRYDSTSIMELDRVPPRLLVVGGGYVGVELGQMFARLGSSVAIVHRGSRLLEREDADVAEELLRILREDGIEVRLACEPFEVETSGGSVLLAVRGPDGEDTLEGSHLLLAAGRRPNTENLALKTAGVETDERGFIRVNDRLETTAPGVYAVGDVNGGPAFTHVSYDDFRVIRENLLGKGGATTAGRLVPYTVFTDPQLGRVGLTEREARASGRRVRVARMPVSWVARALETGETRGLLKAVVDADDETVLGCAFLGPEGGELAAVVQAAMMGGLPFTRLRDAVFAHPTLAESLNNLFGNFEAG